MEILEKLMVGIAFLLMLSAGLCECGEISLKAFLILGVLYLCLLFQLALTLEPFQQQEADKNQQDNADDER